MAITHSRIVVSTFVGFLLFCKVVCVAAQLACSSCTTRCGKLDKCCSRESSLTMASGMTALRTRDVFTIRSASTGDNVEWLDSIICPFLNPLYLRP